MTARQGGILRYLAGGALVLIGIVILLQKLEIIDELAWSFWPVILILIGGFVIVRGRR